MSGRGDDKRDSFRHEKGNSRHKTEMSDDDESTSHGRHTKRSRSKTSHAHKKRKRSHRKRRSSSSSSTESDNKNAQNTLANHRLLAKLTARGETLEERRERRAQKRAAHISAAFGYTADDNPFNDPNLHESFTWKKKKEKSGDEGKAIKMDETLSEIDKVRQRRKDREEQIEEMERIRAEESRMRELENADEWERKEEEFHLQQQRQRSAIRLVEGRERPIDIFAKNMLMFGLSEEEKKYSAAVKYKEKYNAMEAVESLEAELEEPPLLLRKLKLEELEALVPDIVAFQTLEATSATTLGGELNGTNISKPVLRYWTALKAVALDEIKFLRSGGVDGSHSSMVQDVQKIFVGQSPSSLIKMRDEITSRISRQSSDAGFDARYWAFVVEQLDVFLAKGELSDMHNKMLARQLERLETKRELLAADPQLCKDYQRDEADQADTLVDESVGAGEAEEELGEKDEFELSVKRYSWQDKYRPRKPRYFNRVRTGYDWNKYNQAHYDKDNPPPKIVQGYKFNVFYPDLIDASKTPKFSLERADSEEFCIIRFHAGPPYEDIAFKIINREWNRSRKRGYKCSFERGVLSLYFNFKSHWYRR